MPRITVEVTPELNARINDWSRQMKKPPECLAVDLLEEYFDDCDDADRISAEIASGRMKTYSWEEVKQELGINDLFMTVSELDKLAQYARFLRWSRTEGDNWADEPLTPEEEAGISTGRKNKQCGDVLTLSEFLEQAGED